MDATAYCTYFLTYCEEDWYPTESHKLNSVSSILTLATNSRFIEQQDMKEGCEGVSGGPGVAGTRMYTEAELVAFGNWLLNRYKVMVYSNDGSNVPLYQREVQHSDLSNWNHDSNYLGVSFPVYK